MAGDSKSIQNKINDEAAQWVVVLSESASSERERPAFEAWRAQGPEYFLAYERALRAWNRTEWLSALRPTSAAADPDLLVRYASQSTGPRWVVAGISGAMITACLAILVALFGHRSLVYETAVGERRLVMLVDGSKIELNTDSKLTVKLRSHERALILDRGEALFSVAHDKTRPFIVTAGNSRVRAVGTAFNVRLRAEGTAVMVTDGIVQVSALSGETGQAAPTLNAGTEGIFRGSAGELRHLSSEQIQQALAWRNGALRFDGATLAEIAAEFNRYNTHKLIVSDPEVAALRIGGSYSVDDLKGFVSSACQVFRLKAVVSDQNTYLSK